MSQSYFTFEVEPVEQVEAVLAAIKSHLPESSDLTDCLQFADQCRGVFNFEGREGTLISEILQLSALLPEVTLSLHADCNYGDGWVVVMKDGKEVRRDDQVILWDSEYKALLADRKDLLEALESIVGETGTIATTREQHTDLKTLIARIKKVQA